MLFSWVNQLFLWPFSIAILTSPEAVHCTPRKMQNFLDGSSQLQKYRLWIVLRLHQFWKNGGFWIPWFTGKLNIFQHVSTCFNHSFSGGLSMFIGFRWPILWNSDDICEFSLPNDALLGLNGSEADTVSMAEAAEKNFGTCSNWNDSYSWSPLPVLKDINGYKWI